MIGSTSFGMIWICDLIKSKSWGRFQLPIMLFSAYCFVTAQVGAAVNFEMWRVCLRDLYGIYYVSEQPCGPIFTNHISCMMDPCYLESKKVVNSASSPARPPLFNSQQAKMASRGSRLKISENQTAASALMTLAIWVGWTTLGAPKITKILGIAIDIVRRLWLWYVIDGC